MSLTEWLKADRFIGVSLIRGLVSAPLRPHVSALSRFTRALGAVPRGAEGTELLEDWSGQLERLKSSPARHPVIKGLEPSVRKLNLPVQLYQDLLSGAQDDLADVRARTDEDLFEYCRKTANPVGRIILMIHGYRDDELLKLSDDIFTAFHITHILRNVKSDLTRDRIYLPLDSFREFGYSDGDLRMGVVNERFRNLIKKYWKLTRTRYERGKPLMRRLHWPLSWQFKLKWLRGNLLLRKIRRYGFDTLHNRPCLKIWDWPRLMGGVVLP